MVKRFPKDPTQKKRALLEAVESVRDTLVLGAQEGEATATLPQASVDALYESGLFALKTPQVLGGAEADLVTQLEVIEAVSRIDPAAGWCLMIGAASVGNMGAYLPDEAIAEVFAGGRAPKTAGVFAPGGQAVPAKGGYLVNGRWSFGSGIKHSEWLSAGANLVVDDRVYPQQLRLAFPTAKAEIHETWQVMGLRGTGSCDFSVSDLFVPRQFSWNATESEPLRGGPLFRLGRPSNVTNEHSAFALGVGRRALDAITELARHKWRGYQNTTLVAERGVFQRALGEDDLKLRAARSLAIEVLESAWSVVARGDLLEPWQHSEMRSSATYSTQVALEVTTQAFQYGGGSAMYSSNVLQQCLRDIHAAAQHRMVSDSAYEGHAQFLLELPDADPLR
ncbi:MAG: acyl-CoA dehydrogenase family protein [Dehalococcoidia bacterium]